MWLNDHHSYGVLSDRCGLFYHLWTQGEWLPYIFFKGFVGGIVLELMRDMWWLVVGKKTCQNDSKLNLMSQLAFFSTTHVTANIFAKCCKGILKCKRRAPHRTSISFFRMDKFRLATEIWIKNRWDKLFTELVYIYSSLTLGSHLFFFRSLLVSVPCSSGCSSPYG